jgi:hypothetical protein
MKKNDETREPGKRSLHSRISVSGILAVLGILIVIALSVASWRSTVQWMRRTDRRLNGIDQGLTELKGTLAQLQGQSARGVERVEEVQSRLDGLEAASAASAAKLTSLEESAASTEGSLSDLLQDSSSTKRTLEEMEDRLVALEGELGALSKGFARAFAEYQEVAPALSLLGDWARQELRRQSCKGVAWRVRQRRDGLVLVGGREGYDPYEGDTPCSEHLPVLCLHVTGDEAPTTIEPDFYHGWARGEVDLTQPVAGFELSSLYVADQMCVQAFGQGWRMAEFHDGGGGWNWWAYGDLAEDGLFWVRIDDQPANPWDYLTPETMVPGSPAP